jgi:hypothetical protein
MVYSTHNHWVYGLFPSSGVLNDLLRELNLFLPSGAQRKTPALYGSIEGANLKQWSRKYNGSETGSVSFFR